MSSQLHYNSKTLRSDSPNTSRGSSLPRTFSKESKLYGMRDLPGLVATAPGKTNTLLSPPPPPLPPPPSGRYIFCFISICVWTIWGNVHVLARPVFLEHGGSNSVQLYTCIALVLIHLPANDCLCKYVGEFFFCFWPCVFVCLVSVWVA